MNITLKEVLIEEAVKVNQTGSVEGLTSFGHYQASHYKFNLMSDVPRKGQPPYHLEVLIESAPQYG